MSKLELKLNPEAIAQFRQVAYEETVDMFEKDIVPEAKRASPVTDEGEQHNIELHRKRPGGTGTNRRSIDADVTQDETGVKAELYTQSGYGGYLEVGTSRMSPQPYLMPSFMKFVKQLAGRIKSRLI